MCDCGEGLVFSYPSSNCWDFSCLWCDQALKNLKLVFQFCSFSTWFPVNDLAEQLQHSISDAWSWEDDISHLGGQFWQMTYILWACQTDLISSGMCFLLYHSCSQCQGKKGAKNRRLTWELTNIFSAHLPRKGWKDQTETTISYWWRTFHRSLALAWVELDPFWYCTSCKRARRCGISMRVWERGGHGRRAGGWLMADCDAKRWGACSALVSRTEIVMQVWFRCRAKGIVVARVAYNVVEGRDSAEPPESTFESRFASPVMWSGLGKRWCGPWHFDQFYFTFSDWQSRKGRSYNWLFVNTTKW